MIHPSTPKPGRGGLYKRLKRLIPRGLRGKQSGETVDGVGLAMTDREAACYASLLAGARAVIEYGTGGSTLLALSSGVSRLVSVETDPAWIDKLRKEPAIAQAEREHRLAFVHVDVGPVGKWGRPVDASGAARYALYAPAPWSHCPEADVVLVDGRFRVAAALESVVRSGADTRIAFHDFWDRPQYHVVLPFVTCVDRVDQLAVFRRSATIDEPAARKLLEDYRSVLD